MPARWQGIREGLRPRVAIDRESLFERLDRSRQARLLWVVGEDGLGKSTLMATYVARRGRPCLWLDLGPDDADPGFLFSHFAAVMRTADAPAGMAPPHARNVLGFARRFFGEWLGKLPADTMIVLDGCEHANGGALFALLLREALAVTPPGVQWCLINGDPICEDLAYLLTLFEGARIGPNELLLAQADVAALLPASLRQQEGAATRMTQACAGSIGALALLLAGTLDDSLLPPPSTSTGTRERFIACAQIFLAQLPESVRDALIALALPEVVSADMLDIFLRDGPEKNLLRGWARRNLVLQTCAEGWRMHPLLRALVREMSLAQWNGGRRQDLLFALARHCERHGRAAEAIRLYGLAGEWGAAGGLVQREAESEIDAGRWARVRDWIEAMPDECIERMPMLRFWLGRSLVALDGELARLCFRRARLQFEQTGDIAGQALSLAGMLEISLQRNGDDTQAGLWVTELDALLGRTTRFPSRQLEARAVRTLVSAALWSATAPGGLAARISRLHELVGASELSAEACLATAACLLEFYVISGHAELANRVLTRTVEAGLISTAGPGARAAWHGAAGLLHLMAGAHEQAVATYDGAVADAQREGLIEMEFRARHGRAMLHGLAQRYGNAQEDLAAMRSMARPKDPGDGAGIAIVTAVLARAHGNPAEALRQTQEFLRAGVLVMPRYQFLLWGVVAAEIEIEHAAEGTAISTLARLERRAQHFCHAPWRLACAMLHAEILRRQGAVLECRQALAQALALHRDNAAWSMVLRVIPHTLARLLEHALAQGLEPAQAEQLIAELSLPSPSRVSAEWPWRARLRVLGSNDVASSMELRTLLGRLVSAGEDGVAEKELALALHPAARGPRPLAPLRRALGRLRQHLGGDDTVQRAAGRWRLSAGHCWVDAWAFEDLAGSEPARALALYRGRLLPGIEGDAVQAERSRLHARYTEVVVAYGQEFELQSRHEAALALYHAALDVDGGCEAFYQGVMRCELQLGHLERARRAFDLLTHSLGSLGGEGVSGATLTLVQRLEAREHAAATPPEKHSGESDG